MSTHAFNENFCTLRKKPVSLFAKATFASGSANAVLVDSRGISSIAYASATGKYTITLDTPYRTFLGASLAMVDASAAPLTSSFYFSAVAPQTKTLTMYLTEAKTPTAPASTTTYYLRLDFDDSSAT